MGFVPRLWRTFRLGLLVIMFIAITFYLLLTTPWAKYFGKPPTYAAYISEGQPIVNAIYQFKAQRGVWPEYLDDIAPAFLPAAPRANWYYTVTPEGPSLAISPESDHTHVGFDFNPGRPAWRVWGEDDVRVLKRIAAPALAPVPQDVLIANELVEFDRRIKADHGSMRQYRAKASLLESLHRIEEARAVVAQARQSDDNHFWPRLAAVALDVDFPATASAPASKPAVELGSALPESFRQFESWVRANITFTNLYYLALAYRMAGKNAEAIACVEQASRLAPVSAGDDMASPAFYLWDMARFALQQHQYPLVMTLTDAWEKMQADNRAGDDSYLALAAAAQLARGNAGAAQSLLDKLKERKTETWARNIAALEAAVSRKDASFRYDPGDVPPPFPVFRVPQ